MKSTFTKSLIISAAVVALIAIQVKNQEVMEKTDSAIGSKNQKVPVIKESDLEYNTQINLRTDKGYYSNSPGKNVPPSQVQNVNDPTRKIIFGMD